MIHEGTVDSDVFITFLKRLLIGPGQPVFLIVDGHPTHKSAAVKRPELVRKKYLGHGVNSAEYVRAM